MSSENAIVNWQGERIAPQNALLSATLGPLGQMVQQLGQEMFESNRATLAVVRSLQKKHSVVLKGGVYEALKIKFEILHMQNMQF